MSEWKETTLGEICTDISYGYTESANSEPVGPKFLRITDIASGRLQWDKVPYCPITIENLEKYLLKTGDIVIARTGATTGATYTIKAKDPENVVFASYLIRYQIDKSLAEPFFVDFVLRSYYWAGFVDGIKGGSAQPGANAKQFASFEFLLPPLPEQKAIAEVLSSLDDKIDLLHRQNKTLEEMAETLFRQWFSPPPPKGGEKSEGSKSPLGDLGAKEDWEVGVLGDILTVKGGTTPSTKNPEFWNGEIHWTTPRDLSNNSGMYLLDTLRKITCKGLSKIGSGLLPKGTLLLSSRAPVGYLAFSEVPIAINQGYIAIIDNKGFSKYWIYLWLKDNMDYVKSHANGSTFQEISKTSFKALQVIIPPKRLLEKFDVMITNTFDKIKSNTHQIRTLEKMRDTLLPKLMSGEVRVKFLI